MITRLVILFVLLCTEALFAQLSEPIPKVSVTAEPIRGSVHLPDGSQARHTDHFDRNARSEQVLDGAEWRMGSFAPGAGEAVNAYAENFAETDFRSVVVPGDTQLQAGFTGVERFRDSKELIAVNQKEWWYRKHFEATPATAGSITRLVFDGVDYFATVWLNGKLLGEHEGTYTPFSFDVTHLLRTGGDNVLAVRITHPWIPKGRALNEYLNGDFTMSNPWNNVELKQPPYYIDMAWDALPAQGNAAYDMGIWRSVRLETTLPVSIENLFVRTVQIAADGSATLQVTATLENAGSEPFSGKLALLLRPSNFTCAAQELPSLDFTAAPGKTSLTAEVTVEHAHLWWSWDQGAQDMYELDARLSNGDAQTARFGIRTMTRDEDLTYRLNGRRIFIKASWFPIADYYRSTPTRQSYERDLRLFRDANFNLTVNFTVVEKPEFYDLCDDFGILVVEELPIQQFGPLHVLDANSPRHAAFMEQATTQFSQIVRMNRNHPSIIEWAPLAEAHDKSGKWGFGDLVVDQKGYQDFADRIAKIVAELAPGAIFHPSLCDFGEQHFWLAGGQRYDSKSYMDHFDASAKFISEYGGFSMSSAENLDKYIAPDRQWNVKQNDALRWFNLPIDVPEYSYWTSFMDDGLWGMLFRSMHWVDRSPHSPSELVASTQLYQGFLLKYATEAYRRKKNAPVQGIRSWDFVELAPGFRFAIVDYDRVPKTAYYFMKQALAPVAVSFAFKEALESQLAGRPWSAPVWVVNDLRTPLEGTVGVELVRVDGTSVAATIFPVQVDADDKAEAGRFAFTLPAQAGVYILRATLTAPQLAAPIVETSYIKVVEPAFAQAPRVLLIGQRKYAEPIVEMLSALGAQVDVYDENRLEAMERDLRDGAALHLKYDAVWLASFEALAKVLPGRSAQAIADAVKQGTGFIHSGGDGSFHGGHGHASIVEATALGDVLPVSISGNSDVIWGQYTLANTLRDQPAIHEVEAVSPDPPSLKALAGELNQIGLAGFNRTQPRAGSRVLITVAGDPLLVTGNYGLGRTVAFTGFTPATDEFSGTTVDNQWAYRPATRTHMQSVAEMLALALPGAAEWKHEVLEQRATPLFETLKNLPQAKLETTPLGCEPAEGGGLCRLRIHSTQGFSHLVHLRVEWSSAPPYSAELSDNDFEMLPLETRVIELRWRATDPQAAMNGAWVLDAANAPVSRREF
jgi:beta-mannosidase